MRLRLLLECPRWQAAKADIHHIVAFLPRCTTYRANADRVCSTVLWQFKTGYSLHRHHKITLELIRYDECQLVPLFRIIDR